MTRRQLLLSLTIFLSSISFGWAPFDHQYVAARSLFHFSKRAQEVWGVSGEYVTVFSYNHNRDKILADSQIVRVVALYPNRLGIQNTLELFDDGAHCDSTKGDHIYGNFVEGSPEILLTLGQYEEFTVVVETPRLTISIFMIELGYDLQSDHPSILAPVGGILNDSCVSIIVAADTSFNVRHAAIFAKSARITALDSRPFTSGSPQWQNGGPISSCTLWAQWPVGSHLAATICFVRSLVPDWRAKSPVRQIDAVEFQWLPLSHSSSPAMLYQNHPNPFSQLTYLGWRQEEPGPISIRIFDITGREVKEIFGEKWHSTGIHYTTWDGSNSHRKACATGTYIVVLDVNGSLQARRLLLIR
jgi:hypothetical protein